MFQVRHKVRWNGKSFICCLHLFAIFMPMATYGFFTAVFCLQWQIIGQIDDVMKFAKSTLLFNPREPLTLNIKLNWSKNIREERDFPTQIVFGEMDLLVCPLLNLAAWLEGGDTHGLLLFGSHQTNRAVSILLNKIFSSEIFLWVRAVGLLGTHSIRKGAASYAARCGMTRDWICCCGRWRMKKQQVDTYIEMTLPYPDARIASVCTGPQGPCKYAIKGGNAISDNITESLVPNIHATFGGEIARVLVLPLLWAAFEGDMTVNGYILPIIPKELATAMKDRWIAGRNSLACNLVENILLAVQQLGDQLAIVPLICPQVQASGGGAVVDPLHKMVGVNDGTAEGGVDNVTASGRGVVPATNAGSVGEVWTGKATLDTEALFSQQFQVQQRLEDLRQEMINLFGAQKCYLHTMNTNVRRIAVQPIFRGGIGHVRPGFHGSGPGVKLMKNPKDLFTVWKEWEFGMNGMKPAKDFTSHERGANKFTYCRRKVFWDAVNRLIARGHTSDTAVDRIHEAYGRGKSICEILRLMAQDRWQRVDRL